MNYTRIIIKTQMVKTSLVERLRKMYKEDNENRRKVKLYNPESDSKKTICIKWETMSKEYKIKKISEYINKNTEIIITKDFFQTHKFKDIVFDTETQTIKIMAIHEK